MILNILGFSLITFGYIWLYTFKQFSIHFHAKFMTMQGYLFTWLFYLVSLLKKQSLFFCTRQTLFQLCLVLQLFISPVYWLLIHSWLISLGTISENQMNWEIYIHTVPLLVLLCHLYFEPELQIRCRWKIIIIYGMFIYLPINYLYTIYDERPVYYFLTYNQFSSGVGVVMCLTLFMLMIIFALYYLVRIIRNNKLKTD